MSFNFTPILCIKGSAVAMFELLIVSWKHILENITIW